MTNKTYRQNQNGVIVYFDDIAEALPNVPLYMITDLIDAEGVAVYEGDYILMNEDRYLVTKENDILLAKNSLRGNFFLSDLQTSVFTVDGNILE